MVRRLAWIVMLALVIAAGVAAVPACQSSGRGSSHDHRDAHRYACPMHPQVTSNNPGSCRICGMPLEHAD